MLNVPLLCLVRRLYLQCICASFARYWFTNTCFFGTRIFNLHPEICTYFIQDPQITQNNTRHISFSYFQIYYLERVIVHIFKFTFFDYNVIVTAVGLYHINHWYFPGYLVVDTYYSSPHFSYIRDFWDNSTLYTC